MIDVGDLTIDAGLPAVSEASVQIRVDGDGRPIGIGVTCGGYSIDVNLSRDQLRAFADEILRGLIVTDQAGEF